MKSSAAYALVLVGLTSCTTVLTDDEHVSISRGRLTGSALGVYTDSLASGWNLNDWGWSSSASVVSSPALGASAVKVTMNQAWSGFVFAHLTNDGGPLNIDASAYELLELDINPGATLAPALASLRLDLDNGSSSVPLSNFLTTPLEANTWSHARVPLTALNSLNAAFFRLNVFNNSSSSGFSFYIDNVVFGPSARPTVASIDVGRSTVGGQTCDSYTWRDDAGLVRSVDFVDDVFLGGYIRRFSYELPDGTMRAAQGGVDPNTNYQGFGYLVSHFDDGTNDGGDSADSRDPDYSPTLKNNGRSELLWQGKHHLLRKYEVDLHPRLYNSSARGTVHATVHWLIATGRAPILFSVTFDASPNGPNRVVADSRAPYGVLAWDGTPSGTAPVSGVSWGEHFRFVSDTSNTGGHFTTLSNWSYTAPNTIPFVNAWTDSTDAEMGIVSTRTYATDVSGNDMGVWFDSSGTIRGSEHVSSHCWGKTSATATQCANPSADGPGAKVPETNLWPYQLVNYDMSSSATTSKKIAWGTDYGAIGWQSVNSFGNRVYQGYPYTSYSTNVVLGRRSAQGVMTEVASAEAVRNTSLVASVGTVATSGPAGIARTGSVPYSPAGFDPVYGVWRLIASPQGTVTFTATTSGALRSPIFVVSGTSAPSVTVLLDGVVLEEDVDFFASKDGSTTWITLNRELTGQHTLSIQ